MGRASEGLCFCSPNGTFDRWFQQCQASRSSRNGSLLASAWHDLDEVNVEDAFFEKDSDV